ncbi:fungal-specific transcription factor domain-containing protein [Cytidiella melzeri]|nr:fungal-specific transcription factor domain-containing protein [Cytidiella melzeri]
MSSQEESERPSERGGGDGRPAGKKRRIRACDMCRRRKVRCDGGRVAGDQCTNCITYKCTCTYTQSDKKRYVDPDYVQNLEKQLAQTRELLERLTARLDATENSNRSSQSSRMSEPSKNSSPSAPSCPIYPPMNSTLNTDDIESSDDEIGVKLQAAFKKLSLTGFVQPHFVGKSSELTLIHTALNVKQNYSGQSTQNTLALLAPKHTEPWLEDQFSCTEEPHPQDSFPEPSLLSSLVDLYFSYCNIFSPLLHRPTFEKGIRDGLHLVDLGFGSTVLLVCAIGAKLSSDSRVLVDPRHLSSAGWSYFSQVQSTRKAIKLSRPTVYDLQIPCLVAIFLLGAPCPQLTSAIIGHGIRVAQDLGAHRRKCYKELSAAEGEMMKRAFWILLSHDRAICSGLGLPCCIQEEDYDVDLPIDCDDEYWYTEDPSLAFKQPPGKPSKISFFIACVKLNQIHARALRTIYALNKSKALLGLVGPQWELKMVAELDSALNQWIDNVPEHLRWDPRLEDLDFFNQSAFLYSFYYQVQIIVHRQYIPSHKRFSSLYLPSLAICTNAARSSLHILEAQHERCGIASYQYVLQLFVVGIVLIINIYGGKRSGTSTNPGKEMQDVHKCMQILETLAPRWYIASRVYDVMTQLATVGDLPLPTPSPHPSTKRSRDADSPSSTTLSTGSLGTGRSSTAERRPTAGSSRVHHYQQTTSTWQTDRELSQGSQFVLPVHSGELSRLPVHPEFDTDGHVSMPAWPAHPPPPPPPPPHPSQSCSVPSDMSTLSLNMYPTQPPDSLTFPPLGSDPSTTPFSVDTIHGAWPATADLNNTSDLTSFLDNQTLALLSTAPNSMEWNDWGTYINNFVDFGGLNGSDGDGNHPMPNL